MSDEQQNDDGIDMETELELEDGSVIKVGDLIEQANRARDMEQQVQGLQRFRENATKLMRGESPDVQAAYEVLRGAGFSDDEARQYAQEYVDGEDGGDQEADVSEEAQIEQMLKRTTRAAEERAEAALRQTNELRLRLLKEQMDKNVVSAIDGNPEIVKMLETLDKTRGREHATGAWRALQEQVRETTLRNLYSRRDAEGGRFSEDWVADEAAKAAKAVAGNYRTVIGDIDGLGRSPETEGELEFLKSKPEVKPPEFQKGMDRGAVDKSVRDFNVDALSRLAADVSAGGETKV
jgi:major membrane immunogen (membrane-anchored lipoprotein)